MSVYVFYVSSIYSSSKWQNSEVTNHECEIRENCAQRSIEIKNF